MIPKKKAVPFILATALACVAFIPSFVSASTTNYELASDPTEVMAKINAMNLEPLSNKMAEEIRGEVVPPIVLASLGYIGYLAVRYGVPTAASYATSLTNGQWILTQSVWQTTIKPLLGW